MLILNREIWSEIYYTLSKNKLRTILTMIGVAWGMFLYVFLLGAAKGVENGFNKIFDGFATNSIFLWGESTSEPYHGLPKYRPIDLNLEDINYLKTEVEEIETIVPRSAASSEQGIINRHKITKRYSVFGDYPIANQLVKKEIIRGRLLNEEDINHNRKVVVIGKEIAEQFFSKNENPIGEYIKINNTYFKVIGVYKNPNGSNTSDNQLFIPFNTYQQIYNRGNKIGWMVIVIKPQYDVKKAEIKIKNILKQRHKVSPTDEKAFAGFNFAEGYKKLVRFLEGMQLLTWIVGGLTILAGVIAISNILLITVKERTLEIGIKRALGAKPKEIRYQILMESVFLTIFSGLIGFIGGILFLFFINQMIVNNPNIPFYNPSISMWNVLAALSLMVSLGLSIGLIPAQQAVRIKPIEALRAE
ncbi:ABC transporter permease [Apibacter muscae]|uniref:ABC transporter permease n=1 Tax=Apibacter muscae TaxID=2509004 RepID=A0A563D8P2_9FLAO|nr:ABC transporter permease [Apibacter muscae]TWP26550.1 ABC transporter permease [Apibacter muscae]